MTGIIIMLNLCFEEMKKCVFEGSEIGSQFCFVYNRKDLGSRVNFALQLPSFVANSEIQ